MRKIQKIFNFFKSEIELKHKNISWQTDGQLRDEYRNFFYLIDESTNERTKERRFQFLQLC